MIIEPIYDDTKVNIARIIGHLVDEQISHNAIARIIGSSARTVYGWARELRRPKCLFMIFKLVDLGCRYVTVKNMNECGVTG